MISHLHLCYNLTCMFSETKSSGSSWRPESGQRTQETVKENTDVSSGSTLVLTVNLRKPLILWRSFRSRLGPLRRENFNVVLLDQHTLYELSIKLSKSLWTEVTINWILLDHHICKWVFFGGKNVKSLCGEISIIDKGLSVSMVTDGTVLAIKKTKNKTLLPCGQTLLDRICLSVHTGLIWCRVINENVTNTLVQMWKFWLLSLKPFFTLFPRHAFCAISTNFDLFREMFH